MDNTRIVITGMGVVSPVGNTVDAFWQALCEGRSGGRLIDHYDASDMSVKIAAQTEDVVPEGMGPKDLRRRDRYCVFALEAAEHSLHLTRCRPGRSRYPQRSPGCGVTA